MMDKNARCFIAGHTGLVGSAIVRKLTSEGYTNLITISSKDLDLRNQQKVNEFIGITRPEFIFLCAGTVGGIIANNTRRGEFIYDNLMIQTNVIHAAYEHQCKKLIALASSCCYPRFASQPISESALLTGELEPTNEPYAISKIAAIKMCEAYDSQYDCNFISVVPCNLYGWENENFDLNSSHVLPALIRKIMTAKYTGNDVELWGTGTPRREFMHVSDAAEGIVFLMDNYNDSATINLGTGMDMQIKEVANIIAETIGFNGNILYDTTKPDGMMVKRVNTEKINGLGWFPKVSLREGIKDVIDNIIKHEIFQEW